MTLETLILCILSSTFAASLVTAIKDVIIAKFKRKNDLEDKEDDKAEKLVLYMERQSQTDRKVEELIVEVHKYIEDNNTLMNDIIQSNKLLMLDRIKHIASGCLKAEKITYEDRKLLHDMWEHYHNAWKGNGDLNLIMESIDELPLDIH